MRAVDFGMDRTKADSRENSERMRARRCPLMGVKRTSRFQGVTSAFDPKPTCGLLRHHEQQIGTKIVFHYHF